MLLSEIRSSIQLITNDSARNSQAFECFPGCGVHGNERSSHQPRIFAQAHADTCTFEERRSHESAWAQEDVEYTVCARGFRAGQFESIQRVLQPCLCRN